MALTQSSLEIIHRQYLCAGHRTPVWADIVYTAIFQLYSGPRRHPPPLQVPEKKDNYHDTNIVR